MRFEKTLIPVFTGVESIKRLIKKYEVISNFYITSVSPGIKCLIINGSVCDESGKPFGNKLFQEKFAWFAERLQKSNFVGIGKVFLNEANNYRSASSIELYPIISANARWSPVIMDKIFVELEDVYQPESKYAIPFDVRLKIMDGMSRTSYPNSSAIVLQERLPVESPTITNIVDFIIESSKIGKTTMFKHLKSAYREGTQSPKQMHVFEVTPFEILEGEIVSTKTSTSKSLITNKTEELIDFIRVKYNNEVVSVPLLRAPESQIRYLTKMISEGKIKKILFKAVRMPEGIKMPMRL